MSRGIGSKNARRRKKMRRKITPLLMLQKVRIFY
jgi:hypothetical protein